MKSTNKITGGLKLLYFDCGKIKAYVIFLSKSCQINITNLPHFGVLVGKGVDVRVRSNHVWQCVSSILNFNLI